MRLGRLPHELLEATDSAELGEIFAYYVLQNEEREQPAADLEVEGKLRGIFGRPKKQ